MNKIYIVVAVGVITTITFTGMRDLYQTAATAVPQDSCGSFSEKGTKEFNDVSDCLERAGKTCQSKTAQFGDHTSFSLSKDPAFGCMLHIKDKGKNGTTDEVGELEVKCSTIQLQKLKGIYLQAGKNMNFLSTAIMGVDYVCETELNGAKQQSLGQSLAQLKQYEKSLYIERDNTHNTIAAQLQSADKSRTVGIQNKYGAYVAIEKPQLTKNQKIIASQEDVVAVQDNEKKEINIWKYDITKKTFNKDFGSVAYECGDVEIRSPYMRVEMNHKYYICAEDQEYNPMQLIVNDINKGEINSAEGSPVMKKSRIEIDWKKEWARSFKQGGVSIPVRINSKEARVTKEGIQW